MDTPGRPAARGESPDPLSELDMDQGARHTPHIQSSALRRITRSQRSDSMYSLDEHSRMHSSRFSVSPRKQTFHLDVGNDESPQKIRVTVETDNGDASESPASNAGSLAAVQMSQATEDRVKRRLFRDTSQTPTVSLLAPSLPPSSAATNYRRRLRSSSPIKSKSASKSAAPKSVVTRTTKVPLRGLSDDEDDELDMTSYSIASAAQAPVGTPKPKRGRPRRSGTPMPVRTETSPQASSPQPEVTPAAPKPSPTKRGRKPRAATPKIEVDDDDNASAADELASVEATPMLESPQKQKRAPTPASRATPRSSNTPGAGRTPRPARVPRLSVTPSRTPSAAAVTADPGSADLTSSFRVSRRGRGRPRRQAMAPDEMAAIAEERDEQVAAETRPGPETEQPAEQFDDDDNYGEASPDPFLDLFPDTPPASRYVYSAPRIAISPAPTSLSSVDLINVQTPAAESTIMRDYDYAQSEYRGATSPLDLLRSQTDYSPEPQVAQQAEDDDRLHFSSAPSPFVQEHSATHIDIPSEAGSEAQNDADYAVQDLPMQSPALPQLPQPPQPRAFPQEQPASLPTAALPQSEVTDVRSEGDIDPVHFSDGSHVASAGPDSGHGYYHGFDDGHQYIAESELGSYADSDRAGSSTPGGMTHGQNTIAKGEDFSMIGLESLQTSFQLSHGPLPEMGEVTSRIVNHSLDAIRQDHVAAPGNDSLHEGASYLDFLTAGSSPSTAPSIISARNSPLAPAKPAQPAAHTPPRKNPSPNKKAMPLAKILGRKSVATPLRAVVEEASRSTDKNRDVGNDKADPRANDADEDHDDKGDQSRQYNDSFSEIPDAVLDAAAVDNENDTVYFSKQQAELTGRVDVTYMAETAPPSSPVPSLPPSSPFPSSPAVAHPGQTPARRQMVTSGPASLIPPGAAPVEHGYAPSPLRQAVTPGRTDPDPPLSSPTPAVTATRSEAVHEPERQHTTEPLARSTQQVKAGADDATRVEYTAESSPMRDPIVTPERASSALLELHTEPVSSPPEQATTNTNSRLRVPSEGFRPSLSPIVRAGRVLQSVTSSPPTPKDDGLLRSPFRGVAIASSPIPVRTVEEDDNPDSDSEPEAEPANYELVEAQLQREISASVAPSEASDNDSEPDFDGEDEHDKQDEDHDHQEEQEEAEIEADPVDEPGPEVQPTLQQVRPIRPSRPESSPPPASSLRAWTLARQAMDRSRNEEPRLRQTGSPPAISAARAAALALINAESSPISSPVPTPTITPTPAERPVSQLSFQPRPKRTADDASLDHGREEDKNPTLPSFRKRARMSMRSSVNTANFADSTNNTRTPLSALSPRASSRSNRGRTDFSRLSAKSSTRMSPVRATQAVQPTPANGMFADNTNGTGSTGRSWRELVFRENGIVGSISNFASKLISRAPSGEDSEQAQEPQPDESNESEDHPEDQSEAESEADQEAEHADNEQPTHNHFFGVQRDSQREIEVERELHQLEEEQLEENQGEDQYEEYQEEQYADERDQKPDQEQYAEDHDQEYEEGRTVLPETRPQSSVNRQSALRYSDASSTHYGSDAIQSMINDISLEGRDATGDVSALNGSAMHGSSFYPRKPEYQYEEEHEEEPEELEEPEEPEEPEVPEEDEPEYEQYQPQPQQPEELQSPEQHDQTLQPEQYDQTLQPEEQPVEQPKQDQKQPEQPGHPVEQPEQYQEHAYDYEPEPMDINSIHEPEQQQDEPEPMDINEVQPSTTPGMAFMNPSQSFYFGGPQSSPQPPSDDGIDVWAIEAERTARISTMPQNTQAPVFPAPVLSAPPVTVSALSPAISYRSTPLSPVEEVLSSSVARPSSVLRSTPPIRARRLSQMNRPLRTTIPVVSTKPAPAPAPDQSRFLDSFFSSPAALPQELAPSNEADVRFNEQARQRTMLEREQRRLGNASFSQPSQPSPRSPPAQQVNSSTTPSFTPAAAPAPVFSQPALAASSSPSALASSPSRSDPRQNSSLGYFSQQMEMIASSPQGGPLANFFQHTYPEEHSNSQAQQPQQQQSQWESSPTSSRQSRSSARATPQSQSGANVSMQDSTFLTPELRPLPPRSASPTKSCIRPRTKPKVRGRVVVIQEGNANRGIPERTTYGEEVRNDRASANSAAQQFALHFGLDEDSASATEAHNPGNMVSQAPNHEYPAVSHAADTLRGFRTEPGFPHFHNTNENVRQPFVRPPSIRKMAKRDWNVMDWVALNEVVHAMRGSYVEPLSQETHVPYRGAGVQAKTRLESRWDKYLETMRSQSEEARHQRHSYVLEGKVVHTNIMAMLVKSWHLDIVDAFVLRSGRIWNEHFVLRRLFSLLLAENQRGVYVPTGR